MEKKQNNPRSEAMLTRPLHPRLCCWPGCYEKQITAIERSGQVCYSNWCESHYDLGKQVDRLMIGLPEGCRFELTIDENGDANLSYKLPNLKK